MSGRLSAQSCPQVHRRDLSKNPTACGPGGQPSLLTTNTVAALTGFLVWLTNTKFPTPSNETLSKRENWLPNLLETEDAMRVWRDSTPREHVLRLYRFLNQCGYTVIGIDAAIEREAKQRRAATAADFATNKTRP